MAYLPCFLSSLPFVFSLLSLCLLSFYALCLSSGALSLLLSACPLCLLCLSLWPCLSLLFLFPFRIIRKKGRAVLVRPLLSCCGLLIYICFPLPLTAYRAEISLCARIISRSVSIHPEASETESVL